MRPPLTAGLLFGLTGCLPTGSNDFAADATSACTPGRIEACACDDQQGQRTCEADRVFGPCSCAETDAGPPGGDGGPPRDAAPPPGDGGPPPACQDGDDETRDCDGGLERRACAGGAWSAWSPCAPVAACEDGQSEQQTCGVEDNGSRTRTCVGGAWSGFGPCDDPDRTCEDGAIEDVPCGLNGRGRQSHTCEGERFGPFSPCDDPDTCVDGAAMAEACGVNGRGLQRRMCDAGDWTELSACEDPDACADDATQQRPCGQNERGQQRRTCAAGQWSDWAACQDPDVCEDGSTEQDPMPCGVEGNGTRRRTCAAGQWGAWSACDDPDRACDEGVTETLPCGLNGRGELERVCQDGRLVDDGGCVDPDVCVDGGAQDEPCGRNQAGARRRLCVNGNWGAWSACDDPDACTNGAVDDRPCGLNDRGAQRRTCRQGQWGGWVACDDPDVCTDGDRAMAVCEEDGERSRSCVAGAWGAWSACQHGTRCDPALDARCRRCTDALEPNDRDPDATPIEAGEIEDLTICEQLDGSDFFTFDIAGPTYVNVRVRVNRGGAVAPVDILVTQPGGPINLSGANSYSDDNATAQRGGLLQRVGRHTIEVRPRAGAGELTYTLAVELEPVPVCDQPSPPDPCVECTDRFDGNDQRGTARALAADVWQRDLTVCDGASDWYEVEVPGPAYLTLRARPTLEAGFFHTSATDADGALLSHTGVIEDDGTLRRTVQLLRAGSVFFEVAVSNGAAQYDVVVEVDLIELPECNDGVDNDGDGALDADDTGCTSRADETEGDPPAGAAPVCANGEDDDEDGRIDYPDDLQCAAAGAALEILSCGAPVAIVPVERPGRFSLDTSALTDELGATCGGGARAGELVFAIEVDAPTTVTAEVVEAEYDTVLFARANCDDPATELGCDDDGGEERLSRLQVELPAGGGFIMLDGFAGAAGAATVVFSW